MFCCLAYKLYIHCLKLKTWLIEKESQTKKNIKKTEKQNKKMCICLDNSFIIHVDEGSYLRPLHVTTFVANK